MQSEWGMITPFIHVTTGAHFCTFFRAEVRRNSTKRDIGITWCVSSKFAVHIGTKFAVYIGTNSTVLDPCMAMKRPRMNAPGLALPA